MFPTATGIDAGSIGQGFEFGYFLGSQLNLGSLGSLDDVTLLRGSDDGQRTLGDGPRDTNL